MLIWWQGEKFKDVKRVLWEAIPMAILWTIWNLRNQCIFQGVQPDWEEAQDLIKYRIAFWVKIKSENCHDSMDDLVFR